MAVQSHIRVEYNDGTGRKVAFVPAIQCSLEQSRDYETDEHSAVYRALARQLKVDEATLTVVAYDGKEAYNESGVRLNAQVFTVNEHLSGFSLTHNPSGRDHWLSDGVDVMTVDDDDEDFGEVTLHPGTIGFTMAWSDMMNNALSETMEAYFPDIDARRAEIEQRVAALGEKEVREALIELVDACTSDPESMTIPTEDVVGVLDQYNLNVISDTEQEDNE